MLPVRLFHLQDGVAHNAEKRRAFRAFYQILAFPLFRISRGYHIPPFHSARFPHWARIGMLSDTGPKHPLAVHTYNIRTRT